jgi:Flp pilus assembly protein TadG
MFKVEFGRRRGSSGQALVLFAVFLIGLVAILALGLDGGNIYLNRRRAQNAADAGATAGARVLALNGDEFTAINTATQYAVDRNGADRCDVTIDGKIVTVVAHIDVPMSFARVLGLNQVTVNARGRARHAPVTTVRHLVPIAVIDFDYSYDRTYIIWDDDTYDPPDPAETDTISGNNRGWLNLECIYPMECGDAGAELTTDWMLNGFDGEVDRNKWARGTSGIMARPVAITAARIGDILYMPIFDSIQDMYPGKAYYHIIKFAAFEVTQVHPTGNPKGLQGKFKHYATSGPPAPDDSNDGGLRTVYLIP